MNLNIKYVISKYGLDLTRVFVEIISQIQQFLFLLWDDVPWDLRVCFLCMNETSSLLITQRSRSGHKFLSFNFADMTGKIAMPYGVDKFAPRAMVTDKEDPDSKPSHLT